jgi:hypothetical protein
MDVREQSGWIDVKGSSELQHHSDRRDILAALHETYVIGGQTGEFRE